MARAMPTDSSHDQTFTSVEWNCQLSVNPGIEIMRCGHLERNVQNTGP